MCFSLKKLIVEYTNVYPLFVIKVHLDGVNKILREIPYLCSQSLYIVFEKCGYEYTNIFYVSYNKTAFLVLISLFSYVPVHT